MSSIIELTQGRVALVNSGDWKLVSAKKWRWNGSCPISGTGKTQIVLGRYILGLEGTQKAYYKDGDPCNCTRKNLTRVWSEALESERSLREKLEVQRERMRELELDMAWQMDRKREDLYCRHRQKCEEVLAVGTKKEMKEYLLKIRRVK